MELPSYTEKEILPNQVTLELILGKDSEAFRGHFPDYAVLPGVVQLDYVMKFATRYFSPLPYPAQQFRVKFQNIISVGTVLLMIAIDREAGWLQFTYSLGDEKASTGKIKILP